MATKRAKRKTAAKPTAKKRAARSARARAKRFPRPRESARRRQARALRVLAGLRTMHADATIALAFSNPIELLVATILSAQCTDQRVNMITRELFKKYRTASDYAQADTAALEQDVYTAGFFRQKTRSIQSACRRIQQRHGGRVPDTMDGLLALDGVARKTANVILSHGYGKHEGVVVDTHIGRVVMRLALAPSARDDKDAARIERDLMAMIPQDQWRRFGDMAVWHGRLICTARQPDCAHCALAKDCPSALEVDANDPAAAP